MGAAGSVQLDVKLSAAQQAKLEAKYIAFEAEGMTPRTINTKYQDNKAAIILYDQIDCDHSGSVTKKELTRMLKALPRKKPVEPEGGWPNGEAPKFIPFEEMLATLDADGDGEITLEEWLENYNKLTGLKAAVDENIDPATGKLKGYKSLENMLHEMHEEFRSLVTAVEAGDEEAKAKQGKLLEKIDKLEAQGIVPSDEGWAPEVKEGELLAELHKTIPELVILAENGVEGAKEELQKELAKATELEGAGVVADGEAGVAVHDRRLTETPSVQLKTLHTQIPELDKMVSAGVEGAQELLDAELAEAEKLEEQGVVAQGEEIVNQLSVDDYKANPAEDAAAAAPATEGVAETAAA
jgi:hypothetical protein